jgi:hypothetical protein
MVWRFVRVALVNRPGSRSAPNGGANAEKSLWDWWFMGKWDVLGLAVIARSELMRQRTPNELAIFCLLGKKNR